MKWTPRLSLKIEQTRVTAHYATNALTHSFIHTRMLRTLPKVVAAIIEY